MYVKESGYIAAYRDKCKMLLNELNDRYRYASILIQDTASRRFTVSAAGVGISDQAIFCKRGAVVRVHDGKGFSECSVTDLSVDNVLSALNSASAFEGDDPVPEDGEAISFHKATEIEIDPVEVESGDIVKTLSDIRTDAMSMDERILDCFVSFEYQAIHKYFLSRNRELEQDTLWSAGMISAMAQMGEEIKEYYKDFSMLGGAELLKKMSAGTKIAVDGVIALLSSEPIPPGEYECVCAPEITGTIVHEAFGHGVEMDMFVKKRALAERFMGKYVASPLVTMHDAASGPMQTATYFFDDEGTLSNDTVVIKDGILVKGMCDFLSAERLGVNPTGNGRRESFERKAYTRMTNTYFEGGKDSVDDMIASIKYGFLLENMFSGMEDPKNWGIQLMVNMAREIVDGKLTGKVFSPIVMTGYVPDLLKSISMISPEVKLFGGGYCGKGYKEEVKVSDGGAYIKARVRLG